MSIRSCRVYWRINYLLRLRNVNSMSLLSPSLVASLIKMKADPDKVKSVTECSIPTSHKHLQQFLEFTYFYNRFIQDYSWVALSLTQLTSPAKFLHWMPEAEALRRKEMFLHSPILVQPDPPNSLLKRWMLLILGLEQSCPSKLNWTKNYTLVHCSPAD